MYVLPSRSDALGLVLLAIKSGPSEEGVARRSQLNYSAVIVLGPQTVGTVADETNHWVYVAFGLSNTGSWGMVAQER